MMKQLECIWVSLGLTGRWTGGTMGMMISSKVPKVPEVTRIYQHCQEGVMGHNM